MFTSTGEFYKTQMDCFLFLFGLGKGRVEFGVGLDAFYFEERGKANCRGYAWNIPNPFMCFKRSRLLHCNFTTMLLR